MKRIKSWAPVLAALILASPAGTGTVRCAPASGDLVNVAQTGTLEGVEQILSEAKFNAKYRQWLAGRLDDDLAAVLVFIPYANEDQAFISAYRGSADYILEGKRIYWESCLETLGEAHTAVQIQIAESEGLVQMGKSASDEILERLIVLSKEAARLRGMARKVETIIQDIAVDRLFLDKTPIHGSKQLLRLRKSRVYELLGE